MVSKKTELVLRRWVLMTGCYRSLKPPSRDPGTESGWKKNLAMVREKWVRKCSLFLSPSLPTVPLFPFVHCSRVPLCPLCFCHSVFIVLVSLFNHCASVHLCSVFLSPSFAHCASVPLCSSFLCPSLPTVPLCSLFPCPSLPTVPLFLCVQCSCVPVCPLCLCPFVLTVPVSLFAHFASVSVSAYSTR